MDKVAINEQHRLELYNAAKDQMGVFNRLASEQIASLDKWMMTFSAGSFGLSFAFMDRIVPVGEAVNIPLLVTAWSCFLLILAVGFIGFMVSALIHSSLADETEKILLQRYEGKDTKAKMPNIKKEVCFLARMPYSDTRKYFFFWRLGMSDSISHKKSPVATDPDVMKKGGGIPAKPLHLPKPAPQQKPARETPKK